VIDQATPAPPVPAAESADSGRPAAAITAEELQRRIRRKNVRPPGGLEAWLIAEGFAVRTPGGQLAPTPLAVEVGDAMG
jgi:hypothetical protein